MIGKSRSPTCLKTYQLSKCAKVSGRGSTSRWLVMSPPHTAAARVPTAEHSGGTSIQPLSSAQNGLLRMHTGVAPKMYMEEFHVKASSMYEVGRSSCAVTEGHDVNLIRPHIHPTTSSIITTRTTLLGYYSHLDIRSYRLTACTRLGLLKHRADIGVGSIPLLSRGRTKHPADYTRSEAESRKPLPFFPPQILGPACAEADVTCQSRISSFNLA